MKTNYLVALLIPALAASVGAQSSAIDVQHSSVTVRVYKAGLLSAFAHDHWIRAPISSGTITLSPLRAWSSE